MTHPLAAILDPTYIEIETYAQIWTEAFDNADSPVVAVVRGFPDGNIPRLPANINYVKNPQREQLFGTSGIPTGTLEARLAILDLLHEAGFTMNQKSGLDGLSPLIAAVEIGSTNQTFFYFYVTQPILFYFNRPKHDYH